MGYFCQVPAAIEFKNIIAFSVGDGRKYKNILSVLSLHCVSHSVGDS